MSRFMRSAILLSLSAALVGGPLAAVDENSPGVVAQAAQSDIVNASEARKDAWRQEVLSQINSYRASKGLYPFKYSRYISGIAQDESNRAVRDENYNHSMKFLSDRRAGTWNDAGEVTALSYRISTADLVNFWKSSPSHNRMLLSKTIDVVGIGVTQVDGSLARKKEPWRLVGVVDGFSYAAGKSPYDTSSRVGGGSAAGPFKDVSANHVFAKEISWVKKRGILKGWSDGTYHPDANTPRYAMAAAAYRIAGSPSYTPPKRSPFKDVSTKHVFYKEIAWAKSRGILRGWSDGTFKPDASFDRYASAALFYRMAGSPAYTPPATSRFKDVPRNHPFYKEIHWMRAAGIANGWSDGTYRAGGSTSRDAMAAFIYRYMT